MVRGIRTKWKQAIAYFFTHNTVETSMLSHIVIECIQKFYTIGLFVRCIVCNKGATNVAAVKSLGCTESKPNNFSVSGLPNVVHVVYDVPHLLNSVRNNSMKQDIKFANGCCVVSPVGNISISFTNWTE